MADVDFIKGLIGTLKQRPAGGNWKLVNGEWVNAGGENALSAPAVPAPTMASQMPSTLSPDIPPPPTGQVPQKSEEYLTADQIAQGPTPATPVPYPAPPPITPNIEAIRAFAQGAGPMPTTVGSVPPPSLPAWNATTTQTDQPVSDIGGPTPPAPSFMPRTAEDQAREIINRDYTAPTWMLGNGKKTHNAKKAAKDKDAVLINEAGADYDQKHSLKEKVLGGLVGWARNGIGGAISGATDRHFWEKEKDNRDLATVLPKVKIQEALDTADVNRDFKKTSGEIGRRRVEIAEGKLGLERQKRIDREYDDNFKRLISTVKLGYKKGVNKDLDDELARAHIDIEAYDAKSKQPLFWVGQNKMTLNDKGVAVPVKDESGNPVTDPYRAPVTLDFGDTKLTVGMTTAAHVLGKIEERNLAIQNKGAEDTTANEAKAQAADGEAKRLKADADMLKGMPQRQPPEGSSPETIAAAEKEYIDRQLKAAEMYRQAEAKMGEAKTLRNSTPTRSMARAPKVSVSEDVFRARLVANGVKDKTRQDELIARARTDGAIH